MCSSDREITQINGSCHCGANSFTLGLPTLSLPILTSLCHCTNCRYTTGVLCSLYIPIPSPPPSLISNPSSPPSELRSYKSSLNGTRFFCSTCGTHITRCFKDEDNDRDIWELATGVLDRVDGIVQHDTHEWLESTIDGGIYNDMMDEVPRFRRRKGGEPFVERDLSPKETHSTGKRSTCEEQEQEEGQDVLIAQCHCSNVRLRIHRPFGPHGATIHPTDTSRCLASPLSSTSQKRWKGSHCLCTSCRVTSGFPIVTWTYVPKSHIEINPNTTLEVYKSRADVERSWCGTCGATVFYWREKRSDMYDIAVGTIRTGEGEGLWRKLGEWVDWLGELDYAEDAIDTTLRTRLGNGLRKREKLVSEGKDTL
jgi:hypothetical protein